MTFCQSGLRSGASNTVSKALPVNGNFSGSATVIRPWSMVASNVRFAMRSELNFGEAGDKPRVRAAEAGVSPALVISIYRHYKTTNVDEVNSLKG